MVYKQYHRVAKCGLTISMLKVKSIGKGRDYCEKLLHEIVVFLFSLVQIRHKYLLFQFISGSLTIEQENSFAVLWLWCYYHFPSNELGRSNYLSFFNISLISFWFPFFFFTIIDGLKRWNIPSKWRNDYRKKKRGDVVTWWCGDMWAWVSL